VALANVSSCQRNLLCFSIPVFFSKSKSEGNYKRYSVALRAPFSPSFDMEELRLPEFFFFTLCSVGSILSGRKNFQVCFLFERPLALFAAPPVGKTLMAFTSLDPSLLKEEVQACHKLWPIPPCVSRGTRLSIYFLRMNGCSSKSGPSRFFISPPSPDLMNRDAGTVYLRLFSLPECYSDMNSIPKANPGDLSLLL